MFFSIATLALAVVVQTLIINWDFVGGARGAYVLRPRVAPLIGGEYVQYLFLLMLGMCVIVLATARAIERSALGYGFAAIRDDEAAAEASGVPTLRLKLIATTLCGGFMGMAGAPLPYYVTYLDPASGFSLNYAVNAIAMPLIGGTGSWLGPVIGAVLVGGLQEYLRVTISSAVNVLVAGVLMVPSSSWRRRASSACSRRGSDDGAPAGQRAQQALRRLRRAGRHRPRSRSRASGSA